VIVAMHQPNFVPWLGFFDKMAHCDIRGEAAGAKSCHFLGCRTGCGCITSRAHGARGCFLGRKKAS
jgi:hypothetical protein